MKFRKKPVVIEAIQWVNTPESFKLIKNLNENKEKVVVRMGGDPNSDYLIIQTLEGGMKANLNDWIIRGVSGELYPCKPDIFEQTYEKVEDNGQT